MYCFSEQGLRFRIFLLIKDARDFLTFRYTIQTVVLHLPHVFMNLMANKTTTKQITNEFIENNLSWLVSPLSFRSTSFSVLYPLFRALSSSISLTLSRSL